MKIVPVAAAKPPLLYSLRVMPRLALRVNVFKASSVPPLSSSKRAIVKSGTDPKLPSAVMARTPSSMMV